MAFIVFEGIDGAGKTSLITKLKDYLVSKSIKCTVTREPGGTPLGEEIRNLLLRTTGDTPVPRTELLLYEAIRAQHVEKLIRPSLQSHIWVLCDRFTASSVAFQSSGRFLNESDIEWLNRFATNQLSPDLTVLLDLPVEQSFARRAKREHETNQNADRFEREKFDFHERVRQSYLSQSKNASPKWLVLDAQKKPDELFNELILNLENKSWLKS